MTKTVAQLKADQEALAKQIADQEAAELAEANKPVDKTDDSLPGIVARLKTLEENVGTLIADDVRKLKDILERHFKSN